MSDRHDTHIDDLFKQKLGNYAVPPPPSSWQQISKVLPQPLPFYQRPRFIGTLIGLALLVGSGVGYLSYQPIQSLIKSADTNNKVANEQVSDNNTSSLGVGSSSANNTDNHTNSLLLPNTNKAATNLLDNIPINTNVGKNVSPQNLGNDKNWEPLSEQQKQHQQNITDQSKNVGISSNTVGIKHRPNQFLASSTDKNNNAHTFGANSRLSFGTNLNLKDAPPSGNNTNTIVADNTLPISGLDNNANALQQTSEQVANSQLPNVVMPITAADTQNITANQHPESSKTIAETVMHKAPAKRPTIRDKKGKILFPEGLTLGVYYNFNNTWIFSPSALKGEQNLNQQLTFGRAHALSFGYDFNPRFAMSLDWVIKSYQGQVFDYVTHMHLHAKNDVRLTYTHFPLLFKYKFNSYSALTRQPMVLNCIAGLEYGSLKAAEINVPNRNLQNDILRNHSWGFVLGADYDVYLTDNYYLTFGVRSSLTTGANKGEFVLPTNSTTNNLLIGGKVGLNYRFVHK